MIPLRTLLCVACLILQLSAIASAQSDFQRLLGRVPTSANAVVILNVEKAKQSPAGLAEGLAAKLEKAFQDGVICVPSSASRFILASEMDLEFMSPIWEAAVMDFPESPTMSLIAKAYKGESDTVEGYSAIALPQDAYVLKLEDKTLGAMWPANRQNVVRWARQQKSGSASGLSPYLQRAAGFSDRAGTEIIMAIDLDGMISPQRVKTYLQSVAWLEESKVDVAKLNQLLASVEGIRIGVRFGTPPNGQVTIDFRETPVISSPSAKKLFLEYLSEKGLLIDDFTKWQPEVKGTTISLAGSMSPAGIRKLLSVIESPAPTSGSVESTTATVTSDPAAKAAKSKAYFKTVTSMFDDLKEDMQDAKNLASTSQYFDKYARRIERMPILEVDPDMLDYGAYVAQQMRQASGAVRMMGIRTGVRTREINSSNTGTVDDGYYYGNYGYGRYGNPGVDSVKAVEQQRGVVRAQEKGSTAANVHEIRAQVIAATADIRRKMTEKYKVQF